MLRITKLTDYATVVLAELARAPGQTLSTPALAARTHVAAPTASKVLKALAAAGLVTSRRGATGGYALAREPGAITLADVLAAIEGPPALTDCAADRGLCEIEASCAIRPGWRRVGHLVRQALENVTLAQLAGPARPAMREEECV